MSSVKTARRLNRILAMLPWVIANPGASVDEVCKRFDYTKAQLVSDLNTVFVCGLPGYGPGDLMVAYVDDEEVVVEMADYFSQPLRLAPHEVLALVASGRALLSSGHGSPALQRGIEKLEKALLPEAEDALLVDLSQPPLAAELGRAAAEGVVMHIEHASIATGETKERDIEPWSVFSTLGNWYVSAHCRLAGAERVFRLDRIRLVQPTGERFTPNPAPPEPVVRYTPSESDVRATIRLATAARWVADYYPVEVLTEEAGSLLVGFSASDPAVAARLLVRLGDDAELVDGDEVNAAARDLRARIAARYARARAG